MVSKTATGIINGHRSYFHANNKWSEYSNKSGADADGHGSMYIELCGSYRPNANSQPWYDVYLLKFTTPKFMGVSKKITIKLPMNTTHYDYATVSLPLRFAVCKSDSNKDMYRNTHENVPDGNQIVVGEWDVTISYNYNYTNPTYYELDINTIDLQSNTTYYLFLWGRDVASDYSGAYVYYAPYISVITEYYESSCRIDDGTEIKRAMCYIDNGDSWLPIIPHIDNGTDWKMCI